MTPAERTELLTKEQHDAIRAEVSTWPPPTAEEVAAVVAVLRRGGWGRAAKERRGCRRGEASSAERGSGPHEGGRTTDPVPMPNDAGQPTKRGVPSPPASTHARAGGWT